MNRERNSGLLQMLGGAMMLMATVSIGITTSGWKGYVGIAVGFYFVAAGIIRFAKASKD